MDLHNLDIALPLILERVEKNYGKELPDYITMLIRSAVESHLHKADNKKIDQTFYSIIEQWGEKEKSTITALIQPIQKALKEVLELNCPPALHEESPGRLPLKMYLQELKANFSRQIKETNRSDKSWNLVENGFLHLERLTDGFNPELSVLQRAELQAGLYDVSCDFRKMDNYDAVIPVRLVAIANWLIAISTHQLLEKKGLPTK